MKKLVLISTLIASLAGMSAFGQGYFAFASAKNAVYDGFSTGVSHTSTSVDVAFLWGAAGMTPLVNGIMAGTPQGITSTTSTYQTSLAWNDILHDPNFSLAMDVGVSNTVAVATSTAGGAYQYNGGTAFGASGTAANVTYAVYWIGWNGAYSNPNSAAQANTYVGWSAVFAYTATALTGIPNSMAALTPAFGVAGIVPEPATLALIGLGGLSLLAFRRRS